MYQEDNTINVDANVVSTMSGESQNITSVADIPGVTMPKPKKTIRSSQRGVTKRESLGDDDNFTSPNPPIDNDESDNIVELTYIPHDTHDLAANVTSDAVVTSVQLDELVDYDDNSVQSIEDNELAPTTSTSDLAQRQSEEVELLQPAEPSKRRKLDMGELMVKTNVANRLGWVNQSANLRHRNGRK